MDQVNAIIISIGMTASIAGLVMLTSQTITQRRRKNANADYNRFAKTGKVYIIEDQEFNVIIDKETKILYLHNCGDLTPLYDENGVIAKGEIKE